MVVVQEAAEMQALAARLRARGKRIALVPTMGALHQGHLSLLDRAREEADETVMSLFVNPIQFGAGEDFDTYPRRLEADCELAAAHGCTTVFAPTRDAMYPPGYCTYVTVEQLTTGLCGASRPDHFRGVTTVVLKLLNTVTPDVAIFGRKDAQQVIVLKRMVADLNLAVRVVVAPTVREPDGLAMSSRNAYLSAAERAEAPVLFQGLRMVQKHFEQGERSVEKLKQVARDIFHPADTLRIEYLEIVDAQGLEPLAHIERPALVALACRTTESRTRLIDNIVLGGSL